MKKLFTTFLILVSVSLFAQQRNMSVGVVDTKPVYPGCETKVMAEQATCFETSIENFINEQFDFNIATDLAEGKHYVHISLVYNTSGAVENVKVQTANASLEAEARRVIALLPKITSASHEGKKVGVVFSTSILVQVTE